MTTNPQTMKISHIDQLMVNTGTWMEQLALDNTRLLKESTQRASDLSERTEEVALMKVAHAYARAGRIKYESILDWTNEKLSAIRDGGTHDANYYRNALNDVLDLSPADLRGAGTPAPRNKISAPQNTHSENQYSPVSKTALASMNALRDL